MLFRSTKGSGRLYELIIEELGLKEKNMLMIGDNAHADKKMAEERGIQALLVNREGHYGSYLHWENAQKDPRLLQKKLIEQLHEYSDAVFPEMTLSLWYFTHRLFDRLMSDGVKNVFFLSREGEFLKSLFVFYQQQFFGREMIQDRKSVV